MLLAYQDLYLKTEWKAGFAAIVEDCFPVAKQTMAGIEGRGMSKAEWRKRFSKARKDEALRAWTESSQGRRWFSETHICPRCTREVSNREYFGKGRKGSVHLLGNCKPQRFFIERIPKQSWKSKVPYPMPTGGDSPQAAHISTMDELLAYWRLPSIGQAEGRV